MTDRTIDGGPTKLFFVEMLTRDIALDDALLDLIDNSVDGAMRSVGTKVREDQGLAGYWCELTIKHDCFIIKDNCGGIPDDLLDKAFQLGRPRLELDAGVPTIGMYGIGMKRAVFKIAASARVESRSPTKTAAVEYTREWMDPKNTTWDLKLSENPPQGTPGLTIESHDLRPDISSAFSREDFRDDLNRRIGEHFGYIIGRGFKILLNGVEVSPRITRVINGADTGVQPYDFFASVDDVEVKVTIGFYRTLTRQKELEEATEPRTDSGLEEAGITVVCNYRVIVPSDRTAITGWGIGSTPKYHPQFRAISGLITFFSLDPTKLPVSTTKRDLDVHSPIYLLAQKMAMEGIVQFTSFTNRWKGREEETDQYLDRSLAAPANTIALAVDETRSKAVRDVQGARRFIPDLPKPPIDRPMRRIAFSREVGEIREIAEALIGDVQAAPHDVGIAAWDKALAEVRKR